MDSESLDKKFEKKNLLNVKSMGASVDAIYSKKGKLIAYELSRYNLKNPSSFSWAKNQSFKKKMNGIIGGMNHDLTSTIEYHMKKGWDLANQKNNILASQYLRNFHIANEEFPSYFNANIGAMDKFVSRSINGLNISGNIWKLGDDSMEIMEAYLGTGIASGRSAQKISRDVRSLLKDPDKWVTKPGTGKYRSPYRNAMRVARTETNMAYRSADMERYQQMNFVVGYEVHLSGQHPVEDICDHMAGLYPKTFQFVGWHPNCFCYVTSKLLGEDKFKNFLKTGQIEEKMYIKKLSKDKMNYVKSVAPTLNGYKNPPYWLTQNKNILNNSITKPKKYVKPLIPKDNWDSPASVSKKTGLTTPIPKAQPYKKPKPLKGATAEERANEMWDKREKYGKVEGFDANTELEYYRTGHDWSKPISNYVHEDELNAIKKYTTGHYQAINKYLDSGKTIFENTAESLWTEISDISHGLSKSKVKYKGISYRCSGTRSAERWAKFDNLNVGDVYSESIFLSSSLSKSRAYSFRKGEQQIFVKMRGKKGNYIAGVSVRQGEMEVLFDKDSKWIVDSFNKVELEENGTKIQRIYLEVTEL